MGSVHTKLVENKLTILFVTTESSQKLKQKVTQSASSLTVEDVNKHIAICGLDAIMQFVNTVFDLTDPPISSRVAHSTRKAGCVWATRQFQCPKTYSWVYNSLLA